MHAKNADDSNIDSRKWL